MPVLARGTSEQATYTTSQREHSHVCSAILYVESRGVFFVRLIVVVSCRPAMGGVLLSTNMLFSLHCGTFEAKTTLKFQPTDNLQVWMQR